jgi:hypothetical protein
MQSDDSTSTSSSAACAGQSVGDKRKGELLIEQAEELERKLDDIFQQYPDMEAHQQMEGLSALDQSTLNWMQARKLQQEEELEDVNEEQHQETDQKEEEEDPGILDLEIPPQPISEGFFTDTIINLCTAPILLHCRVDDSQELYQDLEVPVFVTEDPSDPVAINQPSTVCDSGVIEFAEYPTNSEYPADDLANMGDPYDLPCHKWSIPVQKPERLILPRSWEGHLVLVDAATLMKIVCCSQNHGKEITLGVPIADLPAMERNPGKICAKMLTYHSLSSKDLETVSKLLSNVNLIGSDEEARQLLKAPV